MKVKDLINELSKINSEKEIDVLVNVMNPEDPEDDTPCEHLELWDNGSESINLFVRRFK